MHILFSVDARLTRSVTQQESRKVDQLTGVVEGVENDVKGLEHATSN